MLLKHLSIEILSHVSDLTSREFGFCKRRKLEYESTCLVFASDWWAKLLGNSGVGLDIETSSLAHAASSPSVEVRASMM